MSRALLVLLLLLAAALRVAYFQQYAAENPAWTEQIEDCEYYDAWALRVADGEWRGDAPFYQPPLYPYALGALYGALRAASWLDHRFAVVYALQMVLGVASLLLVFAIGRRLFGEAAGLLAALLCVAYGNLMFWEIKLLATTVDVLLGLVAVAALLAACRIDGRSAAPAAVSRVAPPSLPGLALAGVAVGLLCLTRADKLLFAGLAALWLVATCGPRWVPRLRAGAAFVVPVALLLSLSLAHNLSLGDRTLVSSNGGINFYFGNFDGASGINMSPDTEIASIHSQRRVARMRAEEALGRELTSDEVSRYWVGEGLRQIAEDPIGWLALEWRKLRLSISDLEADIGWSMEAESHYAPVLRWLRLPFGVLLGLGVAGAVLHLGAGRRDRSVAVALLLLFVVAAYAVLLGFFMGARFRLGAAPMLAILAGGAITGWWRTLRAGRGGRAVVAGMIGVALPLWAAWEKAHHTTPGAPRPIADQLYANATQIIGQAHMARREFGKAEDAFGRVLERDPDSFKAWFALGVVAFEREQAFDAAADGPRRRELRDRAREALLNSRARFPSFPRTHYLLGRLCLDDEDKRVTEALEHLERARHLDPGNLEFRKWYVRALIANGRVGDARAELETLYPNDPEIPELRRRVGLPPLPAPAPGG